ncbi:MAG: hypothetical protein HOP19_22115, partial [Acidobacteria bacterium]|nr:hypothetical protein [Acidobacteriota bacterium]
SPTHRRHIADTSPTHRRHIADTSPTHRRHIADTSPTHRRHIADTSKDDADNRMAKFASCQKAHFECATALTSPTQI